MTQKEIIRRTSDCRVKLAPSVLERLERVADRFGMPSATYAAFAIADHLDRYEANQRLARMAVMDVARNSGMNMTDEHFERVFGPLLERVVKELALSPGALDREPAGEAGK